MRNHFQVVVVVGWVQGKLYLNIKGKILHNPAHRKSIIYKSLGVRMT